MNASINGEYAQSIEDAISAWLDGQPADLDGFYGMMRYQLGQRDATLTSRRRAHERRFGTLLCLLSAAAVGGTHRDALRAAAALALLFASFRIHDDIERHHMGSADRPALWTRWGMPQAINTGDGLVSLAANAMLDAVDDVEASVALAREMAGASLSFMGGQHSLLLLDHEAGANGGEYLAAIESTSGTLGGYSAWCGAVLGGADHSLQAHLKSFGSALGTAFGIRESVNGADGDREISARATHHIAQYVDRALNALVTAPITDPGKQRLVAFAREMVA